MKIILSPTAGFCFGVNRAVNKVEELLASGERICTLGPLIHNPQYIKSLEDRGAPIVQSTDEVPPGSHLVIRAHGITRDEREKIEASGVAVTDLTCPFVNKIKLIVERHTTPENVLLIAGNEDHPEVRGFRSYANGRSFVFSDANELLSLLDSGEFGADTEIIVTAQTTFNVEEFTKCREIIAENCSNAKIFDTICDATSKRQNDACNLAKTCDIMLIIGGKVSSNTQKLKNVCERYAKTYLIESADELSGIDFGGVGTVGITAGASTPAWIIKEVIRSMSDNINNVAVAAEAEGQAVVAAEEAAAEMTAAPAEEPAVEAAAEAVEEAVEAPVEAAEEAADSEESFAQLFEDSIAQGSLNSDQKVKGVVLRVTPTEIQVDVGRKQTGIVSADEYSYDPSADFTKEVSEGDILDLIIMKTNDVEGTIQLSKKRYDAAANWDLIVEAKENNANLEGMVSEVLEKGVIIFYKGTRVFIPGSQASAQRGVKLETLLNKTVEFKILDIDPKRRRVVGSIKKVEQEQRKAAAEKFWTDARVGDEFTGKVVSICKFGVFVEVAYGIQGLCHMSQLSWSRVKDEAAIREICKEGDDFYVRIIKLDPEAKKISFTHRRDEDNPWEVFKRNFHVGDAIEVPIVKLQTFGAFARIMDPDIDGLIHISQIANHRVENVADELTVGQTVKVKITKIDDEKRRISLSIAELLPKEAAPAKEGFEDEAESDSFTGAIDIDVLAARAREQEKRDAAKKKEAEAEDEDFE